MLRSKLIKLAHEHPEFRKDILPLLKTGVAVTPLHISKPDMSGTLCGISRDKAVRTRARVIKLEDVPRVEPTSSWCQKCLAVAEKIGIRPKPVIFPKPMRMAKDPE